MQPQSSSHYPPAQENAWSGEYASSKTLHDRQQQSVTSSVHRSTADQRAPSALLTGQTPHPQTPTWKGEVKNLKSSLYPRRSEKRALKSSRSWVTMPTCTDTSSGEQARRRLKCVKSDFISWDSHSFNLTSKSGDAWHHIWHKNVLSLELNIEVV